MWAKRKKDKKGSDPLTGKKKPERRCEIKMGNRQRKVGRRTRPRRIANDAGRQGKNRQKGNRGKTGRRRGDNSIGKLSGAKPRLLTGTREKFKKKGKVGGSN